MNVKLQARPTKGKISVDVREPGPSGLTIGDVVRAVFRDECLVPNVDCDDCPCSICEMIRAVPREKCEATAPDLGTGRTLRCAFNQHGEDLPHTADGMQWRDGEAARGMGGRR